MRLEHPKPMREVLNAGGAYVRRALPFNGRDMLAGDTLTAEEVASIPINNRRALVNTGHIELWPAAPAGSVAPGEPADGPTERFAIHLGGGRHIVVEGVKITAETITRAEALVLCGQPAEH